MDKEKRFYTAPQPDQLPGSAVTKIIPKDRNAKESYKVVQDGVVPDWKKYDFRGQNEITPRED